MELTGRASRRGGEWVLTDGAGKQYRLSGEALPARCDGLMVRVVGVLEDSFGLGVLHEEAVLRVQRWRVV